MRHRTRLPRTSARLALAASITFAAASGAAPVSSQFYLSGVAGRGVYDLTRLEALPPVTQTVTFTSGAGPQTHTYTGAELWNLLGQAGIPTNPAVKGDLLRKFVIAVGTDGYQAVFSLGELSPEFGNGQSLVAYAEETGGTTLPLGGDGFARTTAPGDTKGGRYVSNLVGLEVQPSASVQGGTGGGVSTSFTVSGAVNHVLAFEANSLDALGLTPRTQTVGGDIYGGYSLWDVLNSPDIGIATDPAIKNDILSFYVAATGSDGYQTVLSMGELSPDFGNQPDLLALTFNGAPVGDKGFARLIVPDDARRGRWVSNLISLEVFRADYVPIPATWSLVALGILGLAARRRGRAA